MQGFKRNRLFGAIALNTALLASTGAFAAEEAGYIEAGVFRLTPKLKTDISHDDNVYQTKNDTDSSTVLTVNPTLEAKTTRGLNEYSLLLDIKDKRYSGQSDVDHTDVSATVKVHQEFTSRHRIDLSLSSGRYHDSPTKIASTNERYAAKYDKQTADFVYGFGNEEAMAQIDVFGGVDERDHKKNDEKDSSSKTLGSTFYYRIMPKTKALVEVKKRSMTYDDKQTFNGELVDAGFDVTSYLVGLSWEATAKTSGYTKFGRRSRKAEAHNVDNEDANAWEVGVSYQLLPYSLIQLSTTRDYGLESDDPLSASFTSGTNTTLSWNHEWSDRISSRASWTMVREEVQGVGGQTFKDRDGDTYSLGASWKVRRWVTLHADYSFEKRDESLKAAGREADQTPNNFDQNVFSISVELTL